LTHNRDRHPDQQARDPDGIVSSILGQLGESKAALKAFLKRR
jgi:hypothetical protein